MSLRDGKQLLSGSSTVPCTPPTPLATQRAIDTCDSPVAAKFCGTAPKLVRLSTSAPGAKVLPSMVVPSEAVPDEERREVAAGLVGLEGNLLRVGEACGLQRLDVVGVLDVEGAARGVGAVHEAGTCRSRRPSSRRRRRSG